MDYHNKEKCSSSVCGKLLMSSGMVWETFVTTDNKYENVKTRFQERNCNGVGENCEQKLVKFGGNVALLYVV